MTFGYRGTDQPLTVTHQGWPKHLGKIVLCIKLISLVGEKKKRSIALA